MELLDLFLPRTCCVCGTRLLPAERHICVSCAADLPLTFFESRPHNLMADRLNELISHDSSAATPYAYAVALFYYADGYKAITRQLKYMRRFETGRYFASMLAGRIASSPHLSDVDAVVPLPLHWTRRLRRGYNQAEVIASEIAAGLGQKCRKDLLKRVRYTRSQIRFQSEDRLLNVSGAFRASVGKVPPPHHVLIVDDVLTTGATLHSAYLALRSAYGPQLRISFATLACVPHDN